MKSLRERGALRGRPIETRAEGIGEREPLRGIPMCSFYKTCIHIHNGLFYSLAHAICFNIDFFASFLANVLLPK